MYVSLVIIDTHFEVELWKKNSAFKVKRWEGLRTRYIFNEKWWERDEGSKNGSWANVGGIREMKGRKKWKDEKR